MDKEKLRSAPNFSKDQMPDFNDPSWSEQTYQYYGERPYWQGERTDRSTTTSEKRGNEKDYTGTVTALDRDAGTMTVKKALISHDFKISRPAMIAKDIKVGDEVQVFYIDSGDQKMAMRVIHPGQTTEERADIPRDDTTPAPVANDRGGDRSKAASYTGTITAIDPQAGTMTVKKLLVSHTFKAPTSQLLSGFKVGDEVEVFYSDQNSEKIVQRIERREKR